jgi:hypothetical protein
MPVRSLPPWAAPLALVLMIAATAAWFFPIFAADAFTSLPGDEGVNGNLAYDLTHGDRFVPVWAYQRPMHIHGSVPYSLALAAFFRLGGPYAGWLSMLALVLTLVLIGGWVVLARRTWGTREAIWLWALWLAPSPFFQNQMTLSWANHYEVLALQAVELLLFAAAWRRPTRGRWALFGLAAGFSTYFLMTNLVFLVALAVAVALDRARRAPRMVWGLPGLAAGFSPAIWYNLAYAPIWRGYLPPGLAGGRGTITAPAEHGAAVLRFLVTDLPAFQSAADVFWKIAVPALGALGLAWNLLRPGDGPPERRWLGRFAAAHPLLLAAALFAYPYRPERSYLLGATPLLLLGIVLLARRLRAAGWLLVLVVTACSFRFGDAMTRWDDVRLAGEGSAPAWLRLHWGMDRWRFWTTIGPSECNRSRGPDFAARAACLRATVDRAAPFEEWAAWHRFGGWFADAADRREAIPAVDPAGATDRRLAAFFEGAGFRWIQAHQKRAGFADGTRSAVDDAGAITAAAARAWGADIASRHADDLWRGIVSGMVPDESDLLEASPDEFPPRSAALTARVREALDRVPLARADRLRAVLHGLFFSDMYPTTRLLSDGATPITTRVAAWEGDWLPAGFDATIGALGFAPSEWTTAVWSEGGAVVARMAVLRDAYAPARLWALSRDLVATMPTEIDALNAGYRAGLAGEGCALDGSDAFRFLGTRFERIRCGREAAIDPVAR